jgi:hypothetical protein
MEACSTLEHQLSFKELHRVTLLHACAHVKQPDMTSVTWNAHYSRLLQPIRAGLFEGICIPWCLQRTDEISLSAGSHQGKYKCV